MKCFVKTLFFRRSNEKNLNVRILYLILGKMEVSELVEVGQRCSLQGDEIFLSNQKGTEIQISIESLKNYTIRSYCKKEGRKWFFENCAEPGSVRLNDFPSIKCEQWRRRQEW